uniref:Uncharacterized protein n=1 Tax=Ascaris lumbricoides TaxID=6252 RepID=A0A0M3IDZ0_ASCLU
MPYLAVTNITHPETNLSPPSGRHRHKYRLVTVARTIFSAVSGSGLNESVNASCEFSTCSTLHFQDR